MIVGYHKHFKKEFERLPKNNQNQCLERLEIFMNDPFDFILKNHALKGKYKGCRSINITGDLRAIYEVKENKRIEFLHIDTHSNLYE